MQIHHLVLTRLDRSEVRQVYVGAQSLPPRIGSMVEVALTGAVRIAARVTRVETWTTLARDGRPVRPGELTVHAREMLCVPAAANEP